MIDAYTRVDIYPVGDAATDLDSVYLGIENNF